MQIQELVLAMKQRTKYYIELPIPQEVNDSNSVTWGEDSLNILELAALAVAQNAMAGNIWRRSSRSNNSKCC